MPGEWFSVLISHGIFLVVLWVNCCVAVAQRPAVKREYHPDPVRPGVSLSGPLSIYGMIALSSEGRVVAASHDEGLIRLWDLQQTGLPRDIRGRLPGIEVLALSRDGHRLAASGPARYRPDVDDPIKQSGGPPLAEGAIIDVWDVVTDRQLTAIDPPGIPYGLAFDLTSDRLAAVLSGDSAMLAVWSADRGTLIQSRGGSANLTRGLFLIGGRNATVFDRDLGCIAAKQLRQAGMIRFWPKGDGPPLDLTLDQDGPELTGCALNQDGRLLAVIDAEQTLRIATTAPLALIRSGREPEPNPNPGPFPIFPPASLPPLVLAFDPSGRRVVAGVADGTLRIYDAATAELREIIRGPAEPVRAFTFVEDRIVVIAGGWSTKKDGVAQPTPLLRWEAGPPLAP